MTVLENGDVRLFDESGASLIMSPESISKMKSWNGLKSNINKKK